MSLLIALAKFAAFTDVFLSGLLIPLIPSILKTRAQVPHQQVQIWTSVLVAAYGGAFAVVSPVMPLLTRRGPSLYAVLLAGLACAAVALALLQLSSQLYHLILARALQGVAAATTTAACSALFATAASARGQTSTLASFSPALVQNTAMAAAPMIAGYLYDYHGADTVFYCAYAFIAVNMLLGLAAASLAPTSRPTSSAEDHPVIEPPSGGYGTISSPERAGGWSRSVSPASRTAAHASLDSTARRSPRLLVALYGYLVVGLLASALQSVLPLFVQRHFHWSVAASGFIFVPLAAPAALVGALSGAIAIRVPKSARYLTAIGFLATVPAFVYLGALREKTQLVQHAFLVTLGAISFAIGLCGDPLIREITSLVASTAGADPWITMAEATSLPSLANAWGSLVGPLFAGGIAWVSGWENMNRSLALVGAGTGLVALLFLQGWIGAPHPEIRRPLAGENSDEESAPLLANDRSTGTAYGQPVAYGSKRVPASRYTDDSDSVSPHTRNGRGDGMRRSSRRRHFSVDNFSIATTAAPGSLDSSASSVRFQAALETPSGHDSVAASTRRPQTSDSAERERRYVMREAPHAPATDPLLAAGSLYVIDEERDSARGVERERQKRRVVVFAEGTAPPDLLARHRHHVVAINALDGTAQMVANSTDNHAVHVTEESGDAFEEATSRRYVVVVVEEGDDQEE
ncbi:MFS general substrate transporter [Trichocladium antarcticum]|uniref:MFS general substrate transporter n=1 Tax=Trichocladium antarcticum TaxID=1450529 RepID=A0AAN6UMK6_9PEZI|nr:MFS general substrate transporter [Trichocladium antarcticum]